MVAATGVGTTAAQQPWWDGAVISDSFHYMPFVQNASQMAALVQRFALDGAPNTVGIYADYRQWMPYPVAWNGVAHQIQLAHAASLPIGAIDNFGTSDCADTPAGEACGFLYIYQNQISPKWLYPNGTAAVDPYTQGGSRSFTGGYVFRILGQEFGRRDFLGTMQPQDPNYLSFLQNWVEKSVALGADEVSFDSIDGIFPMFWNGGWGCAGTWEGIGFQDYLASHFSQSQLASMGITDLGTFCMSQYITSHYQVTGISGNYSEARGVFPYSWPPETVHLSDTSTLMRDPVVKSYVFYQYKSLETFLGNLTSGLNSYAVAQGKSILLSANGFETWTPETNSIHGVTGILMSPFFGVDAVERSDMYLPPFQADSAVCKTGLAAVDYSKPVWVYNGDGILWDSNIYSQPSPPQNASALMETKIADAYASGCLRLVPLNAGTQQEGWPQHRLINGSEVNPVSSYYRFIQNNSALFSLAAKSTAKVALVYSIPDVVWNYFPTFGMYASAYQAEVGGWARALEMSHVPYDIVLLGMNGLYQTPGLGGLLSKYDVVVAPGAANVPGQDFQALQSFVAKGGKLVTTGDFGSFDDMNNPRDQASTSSLLSGSGVTVVPPGLGFALQSGLEQGRIDAAALGRIQSVLFSAVPSSDLVRTTAPTTVLVSPMLGSGWMAIHLVNYGYGYNSSTDWSNPTGQLKLNLTLPAGFRLTDADLMSPDSPTNSTPLKYSLSNGNLEVTVPNLRTWDVILLNPEAVSAPASASSTSSASSSSSPSAGTTTASAATGLPSGLWNPFYVGAAVILVAAVVVIAVRARKSRAPAQLRVWSDSRDRPLRQRGTSCWGAGLPAESIPTEGRREPRLRGPG